MLPRRLRRLGGRGSPRGVLHTGATDHFAREREVERRQPDRAIANDFGGRAALPEQDHGAEDWVVGGSTGLRRVKVTVRVRPEGACC